MRRRQATLLVAGLVALALGGRAHARSPSAEERLGTAWAAFERGDYAGGLEWASNDELARRVKRNDDYLRWVEAESAYYGGDYARAATVYARIARLGGSRFAPRASWRQADALWMAGEQKAAAALYKRLLGKRGGDGAVAQLRLAEVDLAAGKAQAAIARLRRLVMDRPTHPLAAVALARLAELGAPPLSAREHILRAATLTAGRDWSEALDELALVGDDVGPDLLRQRDFRLGDTLFKMRRQYARAGELLLSVWQRMGSNAAYALFHGARGLSRGDRDDEAIRWYKKVVEKFPRSKWAAEAQYLSGWLEFNRGNYRAAIPPLEGVLARYGKSKFADDALWHLGFAHLLLAEPALALPLLARLAGHRGELEGGKGRYWHARALALTGQRDAARKEWRALVNTYPLSWYAMLARSRLAEAGERIGPWGDAEHERQARKASAHVLAIDHLDPRVVADPAVAKVDELARAGMARAAAEELERAEHGLLARYKASRALPVLFDRYHELGNFNRPWYLAEIYGDHALRAMPMGPARALWQHAYPLAYRKLVERHQALGKNPPYYLYAIMRKESGFDAHGVSYADAIGLMQMIPPTTRRVCRSMGLPYTADLLYDPDKNIEVAAWYVGHLAQKFKEQIPLAAGSYNGGPRPMMRWLDKHPDRPMDELVELAAFTQAREYMKKVTANYAHYLLLYAHEDYQQPLTVDARYLRDQINY
jgi:soluble lytic murein transglycosylase